MSGGSSSGSSVGGGNGEVMTPLSTAASGSSNACGGDERLTV